MLSRLGAEKIARRGGTLRPGALLCLLVLTVAVLPVARAQEQSPSQSAPPPPPAQAQTTPQQQTINVNAATPLAKQNLSLVGASAKDIEAVLKLEPGLMIELKRWAADDATSHGQILTADDLTDEAIFTRLETEAKFRGVATLLLQRYGYLIPEINPKSQQGQQQDLLMKERTMQIARIEEEQRSAPPTPPPTQKTNQGLTCNPFQDPSCLRSAQVSAPGYVAGLGGSPVGGTMPYMGTLPVMPYSTPFLEQEIQAPLSNAGAAQSQAALMGSTGEGGDSSSGLSQAMAARANGGMLQGTLSPASMAGGGLPMGMGGGSETPLSLAGGSQPAVYQPWYNQPTRGAIGGHGGELSARMVSQPNPFSTLPSLYDMYMQAAPQPRQLQRFGEAFFLNSPAANQLIPMDLPVGPNYVVGPGDVLTVNMWGGVSGRLERTVDRTGRIVLPEAGPVAVSGQTLGSVQELVEHTLRTQYRDESADVSLTLLRSVRVYVVGDVQKPGAYDVSSLSTPLNAELAAGGPTSIGSLRVIEHWRDGKLLQTLDVYNLLLHGVSSDVKPIENGDTVKIPSVGSQVAVEGMVRRPAIYELNGEKSLADVLSLAGGILPTATLDHIEVDRLVEHEKRTMVNINIADNSDPAKVEQQLAAFKIQNGDRIDVFPIAAYTQDAVYLEGHVLRPGKYAYHPGMKLTDLFSSYKDLLPMPSSYAEIIRLTPPDFHPSVDSFNLSQAMANPAAAPKLDPLDTVRIYSRYDFTSPPTVFVGGDVRHPGLYPTSGQIHLSDAIALAGGVSPDADMSYAQVFHAQSSGLMKVSSVNLGDALAGNPIDNIILGSRDLVLVQPNPARADPAVVYIKGDVNQPGRYPLAANMHISDLIRMGGGLKRSADPSIADLMRYAVENDNSLKGERMTVSISAALGDNPKDNLKLHDGDVLTVRELPGWADIDASVSVSGEVVHPGTYPIRPGERLSSVLERAGGFLPTAYPQGIVFERQEVKQLQQESRQQLIQELRQESATYKTSLQTNAAEQAQLQEAAYVQNQRAITALEQAPVTGRMVIRMPAQLNRFRGTTDDITLRAGDTVVVPKRPDFVLVTGQVYNSNAITYTPHRNAEWYLKQAGGPTPEANLHAAFIVRANGSIVSGRSGGWWTHGGVLGTQIEPGDSIVVPEKPLGGNVLWRDLVSVAQIASSAAVTAAVATNF